MKLDTVNAAVDTTVLATDSVVPQADTGVASFASSSVNDIELRYNIAKNNELNPNIKAMFDTRMRLTDAQHYAAKKGEFENLLKTMQFTHEEAKAETPVSACGTDLNVITTVRTICSLGLSNFINLIKKDTLKKMILVDLETFMLDAF